MERRLAPPWLKLLVSGRPEKDVAVALARVIEPSDENNLLDLRVVSRVMAENFSVSHCRGVLSPRQAVDNTLATNAGCVFLYLKVVETHLHDQQPLLPPLLVVGADAGVQEVKDVGDVGAGSRGPRRASGVAAGAAAAGVGRHVRGDVRTAVHQVGRASTTPCR